MKTLRFKSDDSFWAWVARGNEIYSIRDADTEENGGEGEFLFDTDEKGYTALLEVEQVIDESDDNDMHSLIPLSKERKDELAKKYGVKVIISKK